MKPRLLNSALLILLGSAVVAAQTNHGEVRLKITDASGAALRAEVDVISLGTGYDKTFHSDAGGALSIQFLPFGVYRLEVQQSGFQPLSETIDVKSAVPIERRLRLEVARVNIEVKVSGEGTLIDPSAASSVMRIGSEQIQRRVTSLPGRSVQDLVITQPGWLYEGNAVLHPRGSEYQTQFVVDGIPLVDNRSPSFGPEIEADGLDSVTIYTAGYPAEFGRQLGGVVELNTRRQTDEGTHGEFVLSGGSYDTAAGYGHIQRVTGKNTFGASASGSMTSHYLNPVVPENYTNNGTTGDFSGSYHRQLSGDDHFDISLRHEFSRFLIPNEYVQQTAGQIQNGDNFETMGIGSYQHILSPNSLIDLAAMLRENSNHLYSNVNPTPIAAFQNNHFGEAYFKGTWSLHHGIHDFKAGVDSDSRFLHEDFHYVITDPDQFDDDTPQSLTFVAQRPNLEQSAFVEDMIHVAKWNINAGLRWDHYQLLLNQNAFSPRLSVARYLPSLRMVLHASYDRIFQPPSYENILISSSPEIDALSDNFLRLPVQPSRGNYYEVGMTQGLQDRMRLDINVYRRDVRNYADDDQLLNTGVSYPISFDKAAIYGAEGKLELVNLGRFTSFISYSYMVGNAWFPVTGGLFLGDDVDDATSQLSGHFPDSQDQRNTLATRTRYAVTRRIWAAGGAAYGSGLPFEFTGNEADALAHYGLQVINRLNFDRGRVRPQLSIDATLGATLYTRDNFSVTMQADGNNLNNRLNVIDFGGLFSGNAIGPGRTGMLRLNANF
ncbi:MAG: TonB-dependent receptor [Terracidiphilus sp.]